MEKTATIEITLPTVIYEQAKIIFARYGLTVEEACVLFIKETIRRGCIPFEYTEADLEEVRRWNEE